MHVKDVRFLFVEVFLAFRNVKETRLSTYQKQYIATSKEPVKHQRN